jgi:hypothetical protein
MILDAYLFDVSRTTTAIALLACRSDALSDDCLDTDEKTEVCAAIEKRFALLNAGLVRQRLEQPNLKLKNLP